MSTRRAAWHGDGEGTRKTRIEVCLFCSHAHSSALTTPVLKASVPAIADHPPNATDHRSVLFIAHPFLRTSTTNHGTRTPSSTFKECPPTFSIQFTVAPMLAQALLSLLPLPLFAHATILGQDAVSTVNSTTYDFVIIGGESRRMPADFFNSPTGGTAGNVVANRLTENPEFNVLLIEAGPSYVLCTHCPFFVTTIPQKCWRS